MSVTTFDPQEIRVTATAREHIAGQIAKSGRKHLRLGISESGCNGFMYTLDYIDQPAASDRCFDIADLKIFVREEDLTLVLGTEVDLVSEGLNATLKFRNPNAESYCGCGESFSINSTG